MKVEMAVLGSPSVTVRTISVDVKQHLKKMMMMKAVESELRSCANFEVDVLGSSFPVHMVSVDVKQHLKKKKAVESELRNCVKVEVAVLCSPSLIVFMVCVDVKRH